ncbi:MAG TPA: protein phosphatase 2C domain-containing protein [Pyrinomonadaceae bacterium]|nr:protein phosphatase 2C domain-containing protein [Pyrinomonadaceae bacterium]
MITNNSSEDATAEYSVPVSRDSYLHDSGSLMAVDLAAATHRGHVRSNNEDHYLVARFRRTLENLYSNLDHGMLASSYDVTGYGMLVADGLGGMAAGEIASRTALTKVVELVVDTPDWMLDLTKPQNQEVVMNRMTERFLRIDETIREQADRDATLSGMGTTLTVAATLGRELIIGHIGDSRAYILRHDSLSQITKDHTLAQALIEAGVAGRDEPATRSMRHVLTAALGSLGPKTKPEIHHLQLDESDQLLLCTDGLTEMVDDKTIASLLHNADTADKACEDLITVALAAGGLDNVTVVLARFGATKPR